MLLLIIEMATGRQLQRDGSSRSAGATPVVAGGHETNRRLLFGSSRPTVQSVPRSMNYYD